MMRYVPLIKQVLKSGTAVGLFGASVTGDSELYAIVDGRVWYGTIDELIKKEYKTLQVLSARFKTQRKHKRFEKFEWKPAILVSHGKKDIYEITLIGGRSLKVTEDHSLFTRAETAPNSRRSITSVKVGNLKVGDVLAIPTKLEVSVPENANYDDDFLTIAGLWIADGSFSYGSVDFALDTQKKDKEIIELIRRFCKKIGKNYSLVKGNGNGHKMTINSVDLVKKFKELDLSGTAHNKRVPNWIKCELSDRQIGLFLKGYFSGDGDLIIGKRSWRRPIPVTARAGSVNKLLLKDIQLLLMRLGILSSIDKGCLHKPSFNAVISRWIKSPHLQYKICVTGVDLFYEKVGFIQKRKNDLLHKIPKKKSRPILIFRGIKKIEKLSPKQVYDFSVKDNENFITNGILAHNSGIGKTQVIQQIAREEKKEIFFIHLARRSSSDFLIPRLTEDGIEYLTSKQFKDIATKGNVILFFDEYDRADGQTRNAVLSLINERKFEQIVLPETVWIVLAGNAEHGTYTTSLDSAEITRVWLLSIDVSELSKDHWYFKDWCKWAVDNKMDGKILNFLLDNPQSLCQRQEEGVNEQFACPRTWELLSKAMEKINIDKIDRVLLFDFLKGFLGNKVSEKFALYLTTYAEVPEVEEVLSKKKRLEDNTTHKLVFVEKSFRYISKKNSDVSKVIGLMKNELGLEYLYLLLQRIVLDKALKATVFKQLMKDKELTKVVVEVSEWL